MPVERLNAILQPLELHTARFSILWDVVPTTGTTHRFTDHDSAIEYDGQTYYPTGGLNASAYQQQSQLQERNIEAVGFIWVNKITEADLANGVYNQARVKMTIIDWQQPWLGHYLQVNFRIKSLSWDGLTWKAELVDNSILLSQPVGRIYSRTCRHILGDSNCTAVPSEMAGSVSSVVTARNKFIYSTTIANPAQITLIENAAKFGKAKFTSGDSNGNEYMIKKVETVSPSTLWLVTLFIPATAEFAAGDSVSLVEGCGHTISDCVSIHNNAVNFGGFPGIVGTDKLTSSPTPRQ